MDGYINLTYNLNSDIKVIMNTERKPSHIAFEEALKDSLMATQAREVSNGEVCTTPEFDDYLKAYKVIFEALYKSQYRRMGIV